MTTTTNQPASLTSEEHKLAVAALVDDPHILDMADEIRGTDTDVHSWAFTQGVCAEWQRRSGKLPHHIGAPAEAIRRLLTDPGLDDLYDVGQELEDVCDEILALLDQAERLVRGTPVEGHALAYGIANARRAVDGSGYGSVDQINSLRSDAQNLRAG